jgi:hypothetical protein
MEKLCGMDDAMLADPQGQIQLLVESIRLDEAFTVIMCSTWT